MFLRPNRLYRHIQTFMSTELQPDLYNRIDKEVLLDVLFKEQNTVHGI